MTMLVYKEPKHTKLRMPSSDRQKTVCLVNTALGSASAPRKPSEMSVQSPLADSAGPSTLTAAVTTAPQSEATSAMGSLRGEAPQGLGVAGTFVEFPRCATIIPATPLLTAVF